MAADTTSTFVQLRPRLFKAAYRVLRSSSEAEDVVQDVWLRWQSVDRSTVRDPTAFLVTTTKRAAINVTRLARFRRETEVPCAHPQLIATTTEPEAVAERRQAFELGISMLLEKLSRAERAAYVLREAFDYSYQAIAEILHVSEPNARQLVTRARHHIADARRVAASSDEHRRLTENFVAAAQHGDRAALERFFAEDVASHTRRRDVARTYVSTVAKTVAKTSFTKDDDAAFARPKRRNASSSETVRPSPPSTTAIRPIWRSPARRGPSPAPCWSAR